MALKNKWGKFGKDTGKAFANFGKALGKTAKVALSDEPEVIEEDGHTELSNAWRDTGKSFGESGKSLGVAAKETFNEVTKDETKEKKDK